jgi:peptidoglycan/LPS O-acetylase OafA/YrhL
MDRKFVAAAFGYAIAGLLLGIYMAASHKHGQLVTHAHIMLVGFVVSFIYGVCHKLWLNNNDSVLGKTQFYLHHGGTLVLIAGLFLVYGGHADPVAVEPFLIVSSLAVVVAMIIMKVLFIKSK